jgi:hypothetical protein
VPPKTAHALTAFATYVEPVRHGRVTLKPESGGLDYGVVDAMAARGWRVCALSGRGWRVLGTVSKRDAWRRFGEAIARLVVTYAHTSSRDGASCANPYVVHADTGGGLGDIRAGDARVVTGPWTDGNGPAVRRMQWRPATGYRACFAGALGHPGSTPFVDRRHGSSLERTIDLVGCCPNHASSPQYAYAAFARTGY